MLLFKIWPFSFDNQGSELLGDLSKDGAVQRSVSFGLVLNIGESGLDNAADDAVDFPSENKCDTN